jgi:hypothetical protein
LDSPVEQKQATTAVIGSNGATSDAQPVNFGLNNGNVGSASQANFFVFQNKVNSRPNLQSNVNNNRLRSGSRGIDSNHGFTPISDSNVFRVTTAGTGFNRVLKANGTNWNTSTRPTTHGAFQGFAHRKPADKSHRTKADPGSGVNNRSSNNIVGIEHIGINSRTVRGHSSTGKVAAAFGFSSNTIASNRRTAAERVKSAHPKV